MANEYYISAGLPAKKTTGAATSNTVYISAGLQPDVEEEAPPSTYFMPQFMTHKFIPSFTGGRQ